jgi:hypothetical protein
MQNAPPRYNSPVRKLQRIVLNTLTALAALLLVTAIFGWIRSMTRHDLVNWQPTDNSLAYVLLSANGELTLGQAFFWGVENRARFYYSDERVPQLQLQDRFLWVIRYTRVSFRWMGIQDPANRSMIIIAIPYWFICCASLALPVGRASVRTLRRLRSRNAGLCRVCGYDLRATPARCPECGTAARDGSGGRKCQWA